MSKNIAIWLGGALLALGVLGFITPDLLGARLGGGHIFVLLLSGALSLFLGLRGSATALRGFLFVAGGIYLALGLAGFVLGEGERSAFAILNGWLVLGQVDHLIHLLVGAVYLVGGFAGQRHVGGVVAHQS